jgi:hypothetical protein
MTIKEQLAAIGADQSTSKEKVQAIAKLLTLIATLQAETEEVPDDVLSVLDQDGRRAVLMAFCICGIQAMQ